MPKETLSPDFYPFTEKTFKKGTFSFALKTSASSKRWKSPSSPILAREKSALRRQFSSRATWKALWASGSVKIVPQSSATLAKHGLASLHIRISSSHLSTVRQRYFYTSEPVDIWNLGCMVHQQRFQIHCLSYSFSGVVPYVRPFPFFSNCREQLKKRR